MGDTIMYRHLPSLVEIRPRLREEHTGRDICYFQGDTWHKEGCCIMDTTNDLFGRYFDDAMRIYAICSQEGIPDGDARIMTYIHVKAQESGRGVSYFTNPPQEDAEAIQYMLGEKGIEDLDNDPTGAAAQHVLAVGKSLARLDAVATTQCGRENPFQSELRARLRLYSDPAFRQRMVRSYEESVKEKLQSYDQEKVRTAFKEYRERKAREESALLAGLE